MSIGSYLRRKWFWYKNPELCADFQETFDIISNCDEKNKKIISDRIEKILNHAVRTTSFYAKVKAQNSDSDIFDIKDFPVINKNIVIENREAMTSSAYKGVKLHVMHTSGSTGIPFEISQDPTKRRHVIAEIKATNEIVGYHSHEKMLYLLGDTSRDPRRSNYSWKQQFMENIYRRSVAVNDDKTNLYLVEFIAKEDVVAIHASASTLQPLVDYILSNGYDKKYSFNVKTVITGGEMVPDTLRINTEKAFGPQCKCVVKYSNEEMGNLAIDNGIGTPYTINVADYYIEILAMDSDTPVNEGEMGRIVITDLFNYATPLIRYDTGDLGVMQKTDGWPVLAKVDGKRRDIIFTPEGYAIGGATMTNLMKNARNTKMWQFIQKTENTYLLKIVPTEGQTPTEEDALLPELKELLGDKAIIDFELSDEIPTTNSQKRRYTVNLYKPQ